MKMNSLTNKRVMTQRLQQKVFKDILSPLASCRQAMSSRASLASLKIYPSSRLETSKSIIKWTEMTLQLADSWPRNKKSAIYQEDQYSLENQVQSLPLDHQQISPNSLSPNLCNTSPLRLISSSKP